MPTTNATSTGHEASNAGWLDLHFESSRSEYEDALRSVGIERGWAVLDGGCGGGSFLPLICELVGPEGSVDAIDLAPENIGRADATLGTIEPRPAVRTQVADLLCLPFADASFDCVWSANVMQYFTPEQCSQAGHEMKRVLKPGGTLAVKDFDSTMLQVLPIDRAIFSRFMAARLQAFRDNGVLGTDCGSMLPARLRAAGLAPAWRKGWLVERWAPVSEVTRAYVADLLSYFASIADRYDLGPGDQSYWRDIAGQVDDLIAQPDFCYREFFVLTVCHIAR